MPRAGRTCDNKLPSVEATKYIHNIDKKEYRLTYPRDQEVVVLVEINKMYIRIPENYLLLLVIESICADGTAISPVIVVPSSSIIEH